MNSLVTIFKRNLRQNGMVLALIFILLFFTIVTGGMLLKPLNITNIILQNSYILMLSIGMLLIIVAGQIDLSVGSIVAFVGALMGVMTVENNVDPVLTIVILLVVGMGIGAWHGFWVAMFNIPSFIVTLGGSLIFRGLTLLLLRGSTLGPFPKVLTVISTGFIPDITDMKNINLLAVIVGVMFVFCYLFIGIMKRKNEKHYGFDVLSPTIFVGKNIVIFAVVIVFATVLALYKGIPNVLIILASVSVAYIFISKKTTIGRRVYAMGGNEMATRLSGINTKKLKFMVFVNMGLLAAIAAIIYTGRLNSANARAGQGFELDAIAACYIGGVSAMGGVGTIPGAILGTFVMGVLNNGMSLMGLGSDWQQVVKGVVLTLAVFYDVVSKKEAK